MGIFLRSLGVLCVNETGQRRHAPGEIEYGGKCQILMEMTIAPLAQSSSPRQIFYSFLHTMVALISAGIDGRRNGFAIKPSKRSNRQSLPTETNGLLGGWNVNATGPDL
jgi:hypothetical protein